MKNVSSIKNSAKESPKTPGGISKSLLTPCRRVGLSRNWKKKGPSPFISPLNSDIPKNVEVKVEQRPTRKRKSVVESDEKSIENVDSEGEQCDITASKTNDIVKTPLRNVELPRKKKSKTFLATLHSQESSNEVKSPLSVSIDECTKETKMSQVVPEDDINLVASNPEEDPEEEEVKSPLSPKPKRQLKKTKFTTPLKPVNVSPLPSKSDAISVEESLNETPAKEVAKLIKKKSESKTTKTRSPNQLTKECIVVIQKKLLKVKERYDKDKVNDKPKETSQPLFDSDSDEAPLSTLNKKENVEAPPSTLNIKANIETDKQSTKVIDDDDEFMATTSRKNTRLIEVKKPSRAENKSAKTKKPEAPKIIPQPKPPSQCSLDDDDDDFFDKKKTILIRKTYEKVTKPLKAKSTGSITQKDIDDLKARIEVKKKMLLALTMTHETEELRALIKKWQKGCQEALMELMDLMKIKCPDKHNMDYSEILQMLKIPASLVGYDSDHDCFNTPDDASAVLSKFNDI